MHVYTVDTFVGGVEKSVELLATSGSSLLHVSVGNLLLTGATTGTLRTDVVDDVGKTSDVAEVSLKAASKRHESIASLGDDDDLVVRTTRSKLLQLTVFSRLYTRA